MYVCASVTQYLCPNKINHKRRIHNWQLKLKLITQYYSVFKFQRSNFQVFAWIQGFFSLKFREKVICILPKQLKEGEKEGYNFQVFSSKVIYIWAKNLNKMNQSIMLLGTCLIVARLATLNIVELKFTWMNVT